jgi:hypothetical protein
LSFSGTVCFFSKLKNDEITFLVNDIAEEEDETGKEGSEEKGDVEVWQFNAADILIALNSTNNNKFRNHILGEYYTPYFEINSPPPEAFTI